MLGRSGLLGLPYPEDDGGGGQSYEVYLHVVEELASAWASVGIGVSVHALSCFGLATAGTQRQEEQWLPDVLGGQLLGAYCLSEARAGSDPAAMRTRAVRVGHDYSSAAARPGVSAGTRKQLISTSVVGGPADIAERKMGLTGSTTATATMLSDRVRVPVERRLSRPATHAGHAASTR